MDSGAQVLKCLVVVGYNTHPFSDFLEDGGTFDNIFVHQGSGIVAFWDNSF
jgi:hypothetical protein